MIPILIQNLPGWGYERHRHVTYLEQKIYSTCIIHGQMSFFDLIDEKNESLFFNSAALHQKDKISFYKREGFESIQMVNNFKTSVFPINCKV